MIRVLVLLALPVLSIGAEIIDVAMPQPEIRLKAMFLYNFAKFTTWSTDVKGPLTFCILGEDRLDRELEPLLQGKTVSDRSVSVRHVPEISQIAGCRVIYVGRSERNRTTQIVRAIEQKSVLVISEYPEAGRNGATINFFLEEQKMRFSVNLAAAANAGINLSSSLLRLARIIDEKK